MSSPIPDASEGARELVKRYKSAMVYLDECGGLTLDKLRKANEIAGTKFSDAELQNQWHSAQQIIFPSGNAPGGPEYLRFTMRKSLVEGIQTFEGVADVLQQSPAKLPQPEVKRAVGTDVLQQSPVELPLSEVERVVDTFVAPSKTFSDIRRNASWWVPWILMAIASLAMVTVVDNKLGMEKVVENTMALSPKQAEKLDQLPPEQRAAQMQTIVKFNRVIAYAYPVIALIIVAIIAAVLLGTFNFGFGARLTFHQCMAISMYASLPGIIKALIAILAISVGGGEGFTFQNPVASNLGALVDPSSHFLYSLTTSLDVFTIWVVFLTGLAYACVTKLKTGTCMAVVFGGWAVVVLGGAGVAALFA